MRQWQGYLLPLALLFSPGLLCTAVAPLHTALAVLAGLCLFALAGIPIVHFLTRNTDLDRFTRFAITVPVGYLVSTAFSVILILFGIKQGYLVLTIVTAINLVLIAGYRKIMGETGSDTPWNSRGRGFLVTALILVLVIMVLLLIPYIHVGKVTPGGVAYRAYFSGDYLKHVAVTAELLRGDLPPENPFYAGETLHYYWMYYIYPAMMTDILGVDSLEPVLKSVNFYMAGIFLWLWFLTVRTLVPGRWLWPVVGLIPFVAYSFEGITVLRHMRGMNRGLEEFFRYNVDGHSRWLFGAPEINGLYRLLVYNMQHIIPAAIFLVCILILGSRPVFKHKTALVLGLLCGLTIGHSGFLGSFLTLWLAGCVAFSGNLNRLDIRNRVYLLVLLGIFPAISMAIYKWGFLMLGSRVPLQIALVTPLKTHPFLFFFLNFGVALPGIAGIFFWRRFNRPVILLAILSITVISLVTAADWGSDVAVKVGYTAAIALTLLLGSLLTLLNRVRPVQYILVTVILLAFIPASIAPAMEVLNFSDIENPRYLSLITNRDLRAYRWIREHLPESAIVQKGLRANLIEAPYSAIPTFAHRHTFCGDWMHGHIFLIPEPPYKARVEIVNTIFSSQDAGEIQTLCNLHGIQFIYWGEKEFEFHGWPHAILENPQRFKVLYSDVEETGQTYLFEVIH